jgi:cytochrome c peroxidase
VSHGIDDKLGIRNAPPIQNMAFLKNYTWDGVSHNLDERSLVPITTDFEMDSSLPEVVSKLSQMPIIKSYSKQLMAMRIFPAKEY